jgi:NADH-quinone oxidoreductase subunit I
MTTEYELASFDREDMIYTKDQLLAPVADGQLAAPHPMVEDLDDDAYYAGAVAGPTRLQVDWVRLRRPEDPTLATARPVGGDNPKGGAA